MNINAYTDPDLQEDGELNISNVSYPTNTHSVIQKSLPHNTPQHEKEHFGDFDEVVEFPDIKRKSFHSDKHTALRMDSFCDSGISDTFNSKEYPLNSDLFAQDSITDHLDIRNLTIVHREESQDDKSPEKPVSISSTFKHPAFQPDEDGDTQLHLAVIHGDLTAVHALISLATTSASVITSPASSDSAPSSPASLDSASFGHTSPLDAFNYDRQTALHLAALSDAPHVARLLLAAGASPEARDRDGNTPLHLAVSQGHTDTVRQLLSAEVASLRNYYGETCLHLAVRMNQLECLPLLLSPHITADVNIPDGCSGRTALHYAAAAANHAAVQIITQHRLSDLHLSPNAYNGCTPLQLCPAGADGDAVRALLLATGADNHELTSLGMDDVDEDYESDSDGAEELIDLQKLTVQHDEDFFDWDFEQS